MPPLDSGHYNIEESCETRARSSSLRLLNDRTVGVMSIIGSISGAMRPVRYSPVYFRASMSPGREILPPHAGLASSWWCRCVT